MGRVGRYKLNRALGLDTPLETRVLTTDDLVAVIRYIININNGLAGKTDIDHLGNRRIKTVGELIQNQLRGLLQVFGLPSQYDQFVCNTTPTPN